jgi:hypothetical protein
MGERPGRARGDDEVGERGPVAGDPDRHVTLGTRAGTGDGLGDDERAGVDELRGGRHRGRHRGVLGEDQPLGVGDSYQISAVEVHVAQRHHRGRGGGQGRHTDRRLFEPDRRTVEDRVAVGDGDRAGRIREHRGGRSDIGRRLGARHRVRPERGSDRTRRRSPVRSAGSAVAVAPAARSSARRSRSLRRPDAADRSWTARSCR